MAIFMDADIVVTGDVAELAAQADGMHAVQVMHDQPRFEWPSVMVFNNALCRELTPEFVNEPKNRLLDLEWGPVGFGFGVRTSCPMWRARAALDPVASCWNSSRSCITWL